MSVRFEAMLDGVRDEMRRADDRELHERPNRLLAQLDPESQVGPWFDAYAESFPSRLAAAVADVRALESR